MSKATYGSSRQQGVSGKFIVIGIVILVIVIGVYVFSQFRDSTTADTTGTAAGHEAVGDSTMRMSLDITRDDPERAGYCIVTALDESLTEIGRREAVISPGGSENTRLVVDIPTIGSPVAADVYGCSSVFPAYLDQDRTSGVAEDADDPTSADTGE